MLRCLLLTLLLALTLPTNSLAQIPDRNLPFQFRSQDGSASAISASASLDSSFHDEEAGLALAEAHTSVKRLELENLKLKLELQKLQVELARSLLKRPGSDDNSSVLSSSVWAVTEIPVSWENPTPENEWGRTLVREAVRRTWEQECGVKFTGWGQANGNSRGIRCLLYTSPSPRD